MIKEFLNRMQQRTGRYFRLLLVLTIIWGLSFLLFMASDAEKGVLLLWGGIIPCGVLFYSWCFFKALPVAYTKRRPFFSFLVRAGLFLAVSWVPITLLAILLVGQQDTGVEFGFLNIFLQVIVVLPLVWFFYRRHMKGKEELLGLKTKLGKSAAEFDFLRSQINPHFLFNALNTIYGLALEEGAERTSESVEKLGDMMRFMLQENLQERIPLSREIEYLNNYIYLQKLRTASIPELKIDTHIPPYTGSLQIAPMLLIPFVENAFKHGISLREPSQVRMSMEVKDGTVFFDVYNNKHPQSAYDPERHHSGIGLANVQQRLNLLYPSKHELVIRDTPKDFFVHLTIKIQ